MAPALALTLAALAVATTASAKSRPPQPPPPPVLMPPFSFGPAFGTLRRHRSARARPPSQHDHASADLLCTSAGTNMVLQQAPAQSAVYGYLGDGGTAVKVTVSAGGKDLYTVDADLNTTLHQPFGKEYGVKTFNHYNKSVPAWKALLKPAKASVSTEYTITAVCTGCSVNATQVISNVVFGDVWMCSGQSNMWLPVANSYSRNKTADAVKAGKYSNIRMMAGVSGSPV